MIGLCKGLTVTLVLKAVKIVGRMVYDEIDQETDQETGMGKCLVLFEECNRVRVSGLHP